MHETAELVLMDAIGDAFGDAVYRTTAGRLGADFARIVRRAQVVPTRVFDDAARDACATGGAGSGIGRELAARYMLSEGDLAAMAGCGEERAVDRLRVLRRRLAVGAPVAYFDATRGLTVLIDRELGADPGAWGRLARLLPGFVGTVEELVVAAGEGAEGLAGRGSAVAPSGGAHESPGSHVRPVNPVVPRVPRRHAAEFRQLLLLAPPRVRNALAPHLDPAHVLDLARYGAELPAGVVSSALASASQAERLQLARARALGPEAADALLALRDTAVNAALYLSPAASPVVRSRIMAAAGDVPLDPAVIARVCSDPARAMRIPALWSGDPLLTRAALLRTSVFSWPVAELLDLWRERGTASLEQLIPPTLSVMNRRAFRVPRFRSLLLLAVCRLWERCGLEEALRLVDDLTLRPADETYLRELAALPGAEGLTRLQEAVAAYRDPKRLVRRLRSRYLNTLWVQVEHPQVDWDVVQQANRHKRLDSVALRMLAPYGGRPAAMAAALRAEFRGPEAAWPVRFSRRPAAALLANDVAYGVASGTTTQRRLLHRVPAPVALAALGRVEELDPDHADHLRDGLQQLIRRHLGSEGEACVIAVRLLDGGFAGSCAELVRTAGAVAGTHENAA